MKMDKKMVMVVPRKLHSDFADICEKQYKTISEVIRSFMLQYVEEHKCTKDTAPNAAKR
jgi:metal-responsive CopG/Arc/MetJ family transcriptional regulator